MLRKRLAAVSISLFVVSATGEAFAKQPSSDTTSGRSDTSDRTAKLSETFSVLHAVGQWAIKLSSMADKKAKSDLVKNYAREMVTANTNSDARLMRIANKEGIDVRPLDPQTEQGKSLLDRMNAEAALLDAVSGDAFDKEYMTLVTNTQQSVIHFLDANKSLAKDQDARQFFGDMTTTVQSRLKTAQDIMMKVYGNTI